MIVHLFLFSLSFGQFNECGNQEWIKQCGHLDIEWDDVVSGGEYCGIVTNSELELNWILEVLEGDNSLNGVFIEEELGSWEGGHGNWIGFSCITWLFASLENSLICSFEAPSESSIWLLAVIRRSYW